jgi:hypothetical protein
MSCERASRKRTGDDATHRQACSEKPFFTAPRSCLAHGMQLNIGIFVLLMMFVVGLGILARRLTVPYPILFVLGGLLISFVPRLPSPTTNIMRRTKMPMFSCMP